VVVVVCDDSLRWQTVNRIVQDRESRHGPIEGRRDDRLRLAVWLIVPFTRTNGFPRISCTYREPCCPPAYLTRP